MLQTAKEILSRFRISRINYNLTFNSSEGGWVLHDLWKRFDGNKPTFSIEPGMTEYQEGQRSVLCHIYTMMNLSEKSILSIAQEQAESGDNDYVE